MEGNSNSKGYKLSDEHKAKISTARKGQNLSDEHKAKISVKRSKTVFLYVVHAHGLELKSTHYNAVRVSDALCAPCVLTLRVARSKAPRGTVDEILGLPKSSLYRYITNRALFQINGVSYIVSRDGNLGS